MTVATTDTAPALDAEQTKPLAAWIAKSLAATACLLTLGLIMYATPPADPATLVTGQWLVLAVWLAAGIAGVVAILRGQTAAPVSGPLADDRADTQTYTREVRAVTAIERLGTICRQRMATIGGGAADYALTPGEILDILNITGEHSFVICGCWPGIWVEIYDPTGQLYSVVRYPWRTAHSAAVRATALLDEMDAALPKTGWPPLPERTPVDQ
jgi:hypothetical protein